MTIEELKAEYFRPVQIAFTKSLRREYPYDSGKDIVVGDKLRCTCIVTCFLDNDLSGAFDFDGLSWTLTVEKLQDYSARLIYELEITEEILDKYRELK